MPKPAVVLVGMPGAGKTTIGRRLARALNQPFVDTDQLIEERYNKPCGDVFSELGEPEFRVVEAEVIAEALNMAGVVALGGGAVVTPSTRHLLKNHDVVWVDISIEEGVRRTQQSSTRPVLNGADPVARYTELATTRTPLFKEVAGYRVRADHRRPPQIVAEVLSYLDANTGHVTV